MLYRVPFAVTGLAALAMLAMTSLNAPARADGVRTKSCIGSRWSYSCVSNWRKDAGDPHAATVPETDADDLAASKERDRRWVARCRPVLRQDEFGVQRYHYAAPGCEFGKYE